MRRQLPRPDARRRAGNRVGRRHSRAAQGATLLLAGGVAAIGLQAGLQAPASASAVTGAGVTAVASNSSGGGWTTTAAGVVTPFGGAVSYGSPSSQADLSVVAMAATPDGKGYWLATRSGEVLSYGDAHFYGSVAQGRVHVPVDGIVPTTDGRGYYLLGSNGRFINFGDAHWVGSVHASSIHASVVSAALDHGVTGYWLLSPDGHVYAFGAAPKLGSATTRSLGGPAIAIIPARKGDGYWIVGKSGAVAAFGSARGFDRSVTGPVAAASASGSGYVTVTSAGAVHTSQPVVSTGSGGGSFGLFAVPLSAGSGTGPSRGRAVGADSASSSSVSEFVNDYEHNYGAVGVNQMPVWTVGADQARVPVTVTPGCNNFTSSTGLTIPIPEQATTLGYSDSPIIIDQPSTHSDWELWQAKHSTGDTWTACWGGKLDTATSDGVFPAPFGLSASGISYLATTITEADVRSGVIRHAIAVDLPGCRVGEIRPADRNDCNATSGQPPYGTWFRFPATVPMPADLTKFGQMVFQAVKTYGMVFTDQAGAVMIQAEDTTDWAAQGHKGTDPITASWDGKPEYQVVASLPWDKLQVVNP